LLWSQAELSRRAKVSVQSVSRILAGEKVSRRVASQIIQALSVGIGRRLTADDVDIDVVGYKRRRRSAAAVEGSEKSVAKSKKAGTSGGEMKSRGSYSKI